MSTTEQRKKRESYKKYDSSQVEKFVHLLQEEGLSVMKAAERSGIPRSTAYELKKQFNLTGRLPILQRRKPNEITEGHKRFLVEYIDQHPTASLKQLREDVNRLIKGPPITLSMLRTHMEQQCTLSLQEEHPPLPGTDVILDTNNCVFLDEIHLSLRPWVHRTDKGVDIALLGSLSSHGALLFTKINGMQPNFMMQLLEWMNRLGIRTFVMNPTRVRESIQREIEELGGQCVFSTRNPMKQCWDKVRTNIKRHPLSPEDTLTPRIQTAWDAITTEDCLQWIKESQQ